MHVQMRTTAAGPAGVFELGKVYNLEAKAAKVLVDADYAHPVRRGENGKWEKIPTEDLENAGSAGNSGKK